MNIFSLTTSSVHNTWSVELVALSVRVQVVAVRALALGLKGAVVEGEDVTLGAGPLLVQLVALPGRLVVVHFLE